MADDYFVYTSRARNRRKWMENNKELSKKIKKKYSKKYRDIEENRLKNKQTQKELTILSEEIGNCTACFMPKEDLFSNFKICAKCRAKRKKYCKRKDLKTPII